MVGNTAELRRRRLRAASATAAVLLLAQAAIGTGVGARPLQLASPAQPGGRYRLPSLYVVNTGSEASEYLVRVQRLGTQPGRDVPAAWVRFARTRIRLRPRASALISVTLVVPKAAAHGTYRSNVVVGTWTKRRKSGAALGAAAATELSFTVGDPDTFPWPSPVIIDSVGALSAAALLLLFARRLGLHVRIERRNR